MSADESTELVWNDMLTVISYMYMKYIYMHYSEDRRGNEVGKVELARTGPRWKNWK